MRSIFTAVLILTSTTAFADCLEEHSQQRNADGSAIRMIQKQCEDDDRRTILVQLKPQGSTRYVTALRHTQSVAEAATGGGRLRDVDGDGVFEYEEIGMCGAGPNCEGWIFKIRKDRGGLYRFFHEGYTEFRRVSSYYVSSGRASCCSWEHHLYKAPSSEHTISDRDFLHSITVGGGDANEAYSTPCFVSSRVRGKWVSSAIPDKRLLALCEVYGPDYIVNPPTAVEGK
jgi:hypothetical protein